jgi:prevent-host-death family protein
MSKIITQRELRNDSAAVLREVQRGASFVVSRNGVPVAELRPLAARIFVSREELRRAQRTAPRVDLSRFRADVDAVAEQSIDE